MCVCVLVRAWLSQSSSASLQSAKVGQPNLSQGGAQELLLCFLLTVEVITSLVMQMSIPLFKLSAMQGSCHCRHIKKNSSIYPAFFFSPSLSTFPFFSLLSFLNQISGTWQHKHQTLMWKTTLPHQKTCQSQSLSSLIKPLLSHVSATTHIQKHCNVLSLPFLPPFPPQPESMYLLSNMHEKAQEGSKPLR